MKKTNNKGFSLIELIIVIAIMAVLVAIIAPNLTKYLGKSKENTDEKNKDEIASTLKTCITDFEMDESHGKFIATSGGTATITWSSSGSAVTGTSNDADAKKAVDAEIEAKKTKSKTDSSKYAKATIKRESNDTYSITVAFGS